MQCCKGFIESGGSRPALLGLPKKLMTKFLLLIIAISIFPASAEPEKQAPDWRLFGTTQNGELIFYSELSRTIIHENRSRVFLRILSNPADTKNKLPQAFDEVANKAAKLLLKEERPPICKFWSEGCNFSDDKGGWLVDFIFDEVYANDERWAADHLISSSQWEVDCQEKATRVLSLQMHKDGKRFDKQGSWKYPSDPKDNDGRLIEIVCSAL